ncbi:hypothetical protein BDK51DRAFT_44168 [Blyttiomyces helicus]|uniref:Uncharacterized protein n=1 Tax=Blyttiomyces helicus TaxID=388810 RepID=A0A4P9WGF3_9FUNG|nr:hypothetical protein BDK51DRAFT_44168 [Blyttiomyces helicus]|eukprot:RKO90438.1 hypothetical protein BDK51DRAFT_44168 [Blyttiomyces helicus]
MQHSPAELLRCRWRRVPVITQRNTLRHTLNKHRALVFAHSNKQPVTHFHAIDEHVGEKGMYTPSSTVTTQLLCDIPDTSTNHYPGSSLRCKGMPFIYMENNLGHNTSLTNRSELLAERIISDACKLLLPIAAGLDQALMYMPQALVMHALPLEMINENLKR